MRTEHRSQKPTDPELKMQMLAAKCFGEKPSVLLIHPAYDKEDNATSHEKDVEAFNERGHHVLNKTHKVTIESVEKPIVKPLWSAKGPLCMSFQSHGAPCWTLGEKYGLYYELKAIMKLKRLREVLESCEQMEGSKVEVILLRSCYSALEYHDNQRGCHILSSARLVSLIMRDVLVVGYLGSDNGSTTVTGLCENKVLKLDKGTACFRGGLLVREHQDDLRHFRAELKCQGLREELETIEYWSEGLALDLDSYQASEQTLSHLLAPSSDDVDRGAFVDAT